MVLWWRRKSAQPVEAVSPELPNVQPVEVVSPELPNVQPIEVVSPELAPGVKLRHTLRGHRGAIGRIAWSPDGRRLAVSLSRQDGNLDIYTLDLSSQMLTRLTSGSAIDTTGARPTVFEIPESECARRMMFGVTPRAGS